MLCQGNAVALQAFLPYDEECKKDFRVARRYFCAKMDLDLPLYGNEVYCWEMNWISCVVPHTLSREHFSLKIDVRDQTIWNCILEL